jgi:rhamnosyltransferase
MKEKIYGVVVLYNPPNEVIGNIATYIDFVDKLYLYDNSSKSNYDMFCNMARFDKVEYISNCINDGISKSLNVIINIINTPCSWLLTMDQDSKFYGNEFGELLNRINDLDPIVGLLSPKHTSAILNGKNSNGLLASGLVESDIVMTSGNLINVDIAKKIGAFDERYFIDCVDWDFCLRLKLNGYKVIVDNLIKLEHGLGDSPEIRKFITHNIVVCNYNPIRRYYITRNKLLFFTTHFRQFPNHAFKSLLSIFLDVFKIIFFEKDKIKKISSMTEATNDFCRNRFGYKK